MQADQDAVQLEDNGSGDAIFSGGEGGHGCSASASTFTGRQAASRTSADVPWVAPAAPPRAGGRNNRSSSDLSLTTQSAWAACAALCAASSVLLGFLTFLFRASDAGGCGAR